MKRHSRRTPTVVASLAFALGLTHCSTSTGRRAEDDRPTLVEVEPSAFLGAVPCGTEAGAAKSYVARLFDLTPVGPQVGADRLELPSSGPVHCNHSIAFGWVVHGHLYGAQILGYDRAAAELVPAFPGLPVLLDPVTRETVDPVWTSECGLDDPIQNGVVAENQITRRFQNCSPFVLGEDGAPAEVSVTLSVERCDEAGVERFIVRQNGDELGTAVCGEEITLPEGVPGEFVEVELLAYPPDSDEPSHGTLCGARAVSGIRVAATCDDLGTTGGVHLSVDELLATLDASCDPSLASLELAFPEATPPTLSFSSRDCQGVARFSMLPPGAHALTALARVQGQPDRTASCTATVEPGLSARAACILDEPAE